MNGIMDSLRKNPPKEFAGLAVETVADYQAQTISNLKTGEVCSTGLPKSNVLIYKLEGGSAVVVRPSGTEPKIKTYFTTKGKDLQEAQQQKDKLAAALQPMLA